MHFRNVLILILHAMFVLMLTVNNGFPDEPETSEGYQGDVVRIRGLFESRKYLEVTDLLGRYQASFEKDVRWEVAVQQALGVFAVSAPTYKVLLDEWVTALPKSWVPLLARAKYYEHLGWKARGHAWAKDTSDEQIRLMQDNMILSAKDAEGALKINPRLCFAYIALMDINRTRGDQEVGSLLLQKALDACPDSFSVRDTHMNLLLPRWGGSHEEMMRFALDSVAVGKNPRIKQLPGLVYWDMGRIAKGEGKTELAIDYFNKALTFGDSPKVIYSLAEAFLAARMPDKALEVIDRGIPLFPKYVFGYGLRSKIFLSQGKWDEAFDDLEKMKMFGGKDNEEWIETRMWEGRQIVSQGHSLYRMHSFTQAIEKYNLALRFDPESAESYCWRGMALHRAGNDSAEDDLRKAISIDPRLFEAYVGLDEVLIKRRRLDEIVELWNRYIELEPGNARAYLERSGTYYHKKEFVSAYRDIKRACDLGSKDACTRMHVIRDRAPQDQVAEIDREIAIGNIGPSTHNVDLTPKKIKTPAGKWSFRDLQGKLITNEEFDDAWDFKDGYARVSQSGKWGFIDVKGNIAIKPQYGYCWDFSGDKAKVRLEDGSTQYIDRSGKPVME